MEKYSRGRRGAPAKGVDGIYPVREFKSLLLRQQKRNFCLPKVPFLLSKPQAWYGINAPRVVWNPDEVAHGIARSAYRIKLLRLDAIHGVAVIPFTPSV